MNEIVITLKRRDDGGYSFSVDGGEFALGGGASNASGMLDQFERLMEIIEDRASGGSGLF